MVVCGVWSFLCGPFSRCQFPTCVGLQSGAWTAWTLPPVLGQRREPASTPVVSPIHHTYCLTPPSYTCSRWCHILSTVGSHLSHTHSQPHTCTIHQHHTPAPYTTTLHQHLTPARLNIKRFSVCAWHNVMPTQF